MPEPYATMPAEQRAKLIERIRSIYPTPPITDKVLTARVRAAAVSPGVVLRLFAAEDEIDVLRAERDAALARAAAPDA